MFWKQSKNNIWVVAHRGVKAFYPENTMVSFENAIKMGVDGIETDIHMTTDGKLVLFHDSTLERTTNGKGQVEDFTYGELRKLDAGAHFSEKFYGERIPLLEELLDLIKKPNFMLNIEMKDYRLEAADKTIALLERYGFTDRYVITCFNAEVTTYVHEKYGVKTQGFPPHMVKNYRADTDSHYYSVGISMNDLNKALCDKYYSMNIDPWCWCPDTDEAVEKIIESGATLATCNNPEPALRILRERHLHD